MTESKERNKSKVEPDMCVGRSLGALEDSKPNKKGIAKAIIFFTLFK
ncbi:hypothetical protein [Niallia nealsonii]|nr:hypothetical protein [Niallia nealsonii]